MCSATTNTNIGHATRLSTRSGINISWVSSRCLLPAPWHIDCHQCRDACPEQALEVVRDELGPRLTVSDACTNCQQCLQACDTEALIAPPVTLSRRAFFRRAANLGQPTIAPGDAGPAPRKRWRQEALEDSLEDASHPRVTIDLERCEASNLCSQLCPSRALTTNDTGTLVFDSDLCLGCGHCEEVCPSQAVRMEQDQPPARLTVRQASERSCSDCGHDFLEVSGGSPEDASWHRLSLCPACRRDQSLMKHDVLALLR